MRIEKTLQTYQELPDGKPPIDRTTAAVTVVYDGRRVSLSEVLPAGTGLKGQVVRLRQMETEALVRLKAEVAVKAAEVSKL